VQPLSIVIEITTDPSMLNQYYTLRDIYFKRDLQIRDFDGFEEPRDREGSILVAHRNGICLAGVRIREGSGMRKQLNEFGVHRRQSCLWERFVMHPDVRKMHLGRQFCSALIDVSRNLGFSHAMVVSTLKISRLYRLCHAGLGVDFSIKRAAPECVEGPFSKLDHYLSLVDLGQSPQQQPRPFHADKSAAGYRHSVAMAAG
jgi:hypothetical protein